MTKHPKMRQEIADKVSETVARSDIAADQSSVVPITNAVMEEVGPRIDQLTNAEPWWQSRVVLGSLLVLASRLLAHFGYAIPEELHGDILTAVIAFGPYIGLGIIAWGRYARKTLFKVKQI